MRRIMRRVLVLVVGGSVLTVAGGPAGAVEAPLFLEPDAPIAARVEVDDVAHFLGEGFDVTVVVQYRGEAVELRPEALQQASFAPFEATGRVEEASLSLTSSVAEYRYSAELRAISAFPGRAYHPPPVPLEYVDRASGRQEAMEVPFPRPLYVSAYYGDHADQVPLRPLRGELAAWPRRSTLLAAGSALLFVASLGLVTRWGLAARRAAREAREAAGGEPQLARLRQALRALAEPTEREDLDARGRLKEIEALAIGFGRDVLGLGPGDFWRRNGDPRWEVLGGAVERRYAAGDPEHADVKRAVRAFKQLLPAPRDGTE